MTASVADQAKRLQRARWTATGLLVLAGIVFILTSLWRDEWPWLNPVWAFAEAALIGGLADWFAVTALFRHPLGLPIPHTAIVPNRKNQIGQALAQFVAEHFLVRSALATELARLDLARGFGRWLGRPENAASVGGDLAHAFRWLFADSDSGPLRAALASNLIDVSRSLPSEKLLSALLEVFATGPHADELIDGLVAYGHEQLGRNKDLIRARIHDKSPWWLPKFVDEEIFDQIVAELERLLDEVGTDAAHPAREALRLRIRELEVRLADDPSIVARTQTMRNEFLQHPAVQNFGRELSQRVRQEIVGALETPDSELRTALASELARFGTRISTDAALAAQLDAWLSEILIYIVETYSEPMSSIISSTIAKWDAIETSHRIELHIGRDLQFIRINGTLVGGLVGLLLYLSWSGVSG